MILSEQLKKLLLNWDFSVAKAIYDEYGESDSLKFLFAQPWTKVADQMLKECIEELSKINPIVQHEVIQSRGEENTAPKTKPINPPKRILIPESETNYPEELQELIQIRKGLFAQSNHARYLLFTKCTSDEERKKQAFIIKANWREIERIWGILNYWKEHKVLSPDIIQVQTGKMSVKEMTNRLKNLRSYISKARSGKKNYKMTLKEMEAERNELERRLNAII